jgi:DNA-binding CsgD family transcriptional regulator
MTDQTLFTREELDRLPFNAELINPQGFRWFAGARLTTVGGCELNLDIDRLAHDEPFGRRELEAIAKLLPHLRRAAETVYELGLARTEGMLDALEQMSCGAILINGSGRVIRLNAHARQHIGRCLGLSDGRLSALSGRANDGLQRLIDSASRSDVAGQSDPEILALPRPGRRPLLVHAAPIVRSAQDVFRCAGAILMLVEPDEPREPAEPVLRQAFGLTPVEAQIALGLARGQDLQEIATNRAVSVGTVRMQIKSIFQKTETHRQAELVALLNHFAQAPGASRGTEPLRSHATCEHVRPGKHRG